MRQHLIGYLLNAVDTDERENIAQQLERDESLRRELDLLKTSLQPLSADRGHHEPPPGLARRCCDFVYSRTEIVPAALSPDSPAPPPARDIVGRGWIYRWPERLPWPCWCCWCQRFIKAGCIRNWLPVRAT